MLESATDAYRDVYGTRQFVFETDLEQATATGSPELLIQMLDKLVDNALGLTEAPEQVTVTLERKGNYGHLSVANSGTRLNFSFRKYSTALTSWLVTASISFTRRAESSSKLASNSSR